MNLQGMVIEVLNLLEYTIYSSLLHHYNSSLSCCRQPWVPKCFCVCPQKQKKELPSVLDIL